jgi:hypothetical protein
VPHRGHGLVLAGAGGDLGQTPGACPGSGGGIGFDEGGGRPAKGWDGVVPVLGVLPTLDD